LHYEAEIALHQFVQRFLISRLDTTPERDLLGWRWHNVTTYFGQIRR
jgi:hypothetical protein